VYSSELLAGSQLVVTATDDPAVNAQVAADAKAARIWVNSADDPDNCTFILPAVARAGRTTVAVSTGGASPALAQHLRDVVAADVLTPEVLAAADTLAAERDAVHAEGGSTEGLDWATRLRELLPRA
jgi:precorrin-2 dehydrogenase/sirohydrochlorin ferrochelatase